MRILLTVGWVFCLIQGAAGLEFELTLQPGWNLVSIPIEPDSQAVFETLTEGAEGPLWEWTGSAWSPAGELHAGKGYALYIMPGAERFSGTRASVTVTGDAVEELRLPFAEGWNLAGPLAQPPYDPVSLPFPRSTMDRLSGGVWTYVGGMYRRAREFSAGHAYWFFALESGEIACFPHFLVIDLSGGPSASSYPVSSLDSLPDPIPDDYKTTKLVLRRLPAGTFTMGSPPGELGRWDDET